MRITHTSAPNLPPTISGLMNWCSIRYEIRKDRAVGGAAPLRLCVTVSRVRWRKDLGVMLPLKYWDGKNASIRGNTEEAKKIRFLVEGEFSKAHKVLVDMQLSSAPKTVAEFEGRFLDKYSTLDFLTFFWQVAEERIVNGEVSDGHYARCHVVMRKIKAFLGKSNLPFGAITAEWLHNFERWSRKELKIIRGKDYSERSQNTIAVYLKTIRIYYKIAMRKGLVKEDPFLNFKIRTVETQRSFLSEADLSKIVKLFKAEFYPKGSTMEGVLKNFLLMCSTGMRISDLKVLDKTMIKDDMILYKAQKTLKQNKEIRIPLNSLSQAVIDSFEGDRIIFKISDQKQNLHLKQVARDAGLSQKITNHTARHTFGTVFLQKGGKIEMLKSLMGHSDIGTTMQYVHLVDEERIKQVKQAFDF